MSPRPTICNWQQIEATGRRHPPGGEGGRGDVGVGLSLEEERNNEAAVAAARDGCAAVTVVHSSLSSPFARFFLPKRKQG